MTKLHQPNVLNRLGDTAAAVAAAATLRPDQLLVFVNAASSGHHQTAARWRSGGTVCHCGCYGINFADCGDA